MLRLTFLSISVAFSLILTGTTPGQDAVAAAGAITEDGVREILDFLASDQLAGRDSPSAGLEMASVFLAERFRRAGLAPGAADGTFFHRYQLPGHRLDSSRARVALTSEGQDPLTLRPNRDFRIYRAGNASAYEGPVARLEAGNATERGLWSGRPVRKPLFLEIDPSSELWKTCGGVRTKLAGRRRRAADNAPILLVRKGVLPEGDLEALVEVPAAESVEVELTNVIGLIPGTDLADEIVIFTAHYDHVGVGLPIAGDAVFNGADDDGTGTTAVATLALAFAEADSRPRRTLAFCCFSAEEKGLRGSAAFADNPPFPLEKIAVNLNIEMIGRPDDDKVGTAWVTGRSYSAFEDVVKDAMAKAGITVVPFVMESRLFAASDNFSLARKGVVAHSISSSSLHADYHKPSDEISKIRIPHMTNVIRGLFHAGLAFANRETRITYNEKGLRRIGRAR